MTQQRPRSLLHHHLHLAHGKRSHARLHRCTGEKPEAVRTHLRDALIVPEMIGSVIGVYNGKTFNQAGLSHSCAKAQSFSTCSSDMCACLPLYHG